MRVHFPAMFRVLMESSAYEAGRGTGQVLWGIGLIIGILKCNEIAKRPTANAKCAYGLLFVLLAWMVGLGAQLVQASGGPLVKILPVIEMGVLVVIGAVLAVLGLLELRMSQTYVQGRAQAGWALVLSLAFACLVGVGFYSGYIKCRPCRGSACARPASRPPRAASRLPS